MIDGLVTELDLFAVPVTGTLRGLALSGSVADSDRPHVIPSRFPSASRQGLLHSQRPSAAAGVRRYFESGPRLTTMPDDVPHAVNPAFLDDHSFQEYLGEMTPVVEEIFRCAVHRGPSTLGEISAGGGIGLFAHVWGGRRTITARNLLGGTGRLAAALFEALEPRIWLGAVAARVEADRDGAVVTLASGESIRATQVVVAVPAPAARRILTGAPEALDTALGAIPYRAFLSVAMLTDERAAMPWDGVYSLATPGLSFDMFFNHAIPLREGQRVPGGSIMVYAGADNAERLLERTDDEILSLFLADLERVYPTLPGFVTETVVQRWALGNCVPTPGRGAHQRALEDNASFDGRIHLAGDYFTPIGTMETSATTGMLAARRARRADQRM